MVINTADIISRTHKKRFGDVLVRLFEFFADKDCLVEFARFEAKD